MASNALFVMRKYIILRLLFSILLLWSSSLLASVPVFSPLPPDRAFALSASIDDYDQLVLQWRVAPGYYLYRERIHLFPSPTEQHALQLHLPSGELHRNPVEETDVFQEVYTGFVRVVVPLSQATGKVDWVIYYQGCSASGFCYTPVSKLLEIDRSQQRVTVRDEPHLRRMPALPAAYSVSTSETSQFSRFFVANTWVMMAAFAGLGLLLAFTPCVLPMVPILSGIIVGHHKKRKGIRAFWLSLIYVAGMALTYAVAGVVAALLGRNMAMQLQRPWLLVLFSGIFILLALSLFGFYELQLPARLRQKLNALNQRTKGGNPASVFLMGCLSTLIVSPCVSAPLVGVLAFIGQTGNVWQGGLALFSLGVGMGVPLLLIGLAADRFLPKAGRWMLVVERLFGLMMLGVAIWMLSRMLPGPVTLFLWGLLAIFTAIFLLFYVAREAGGWLRWLIRSVSIIGFVLGMIYLVGALEGNADPLHPLSSEKISKTYFTSITSLDALDAALQTAKDAHRPVLLDVYADWCAPCVLMDRSVFAKENVREALAGFVRLRVDVTGNEPERLAILQRYQLLGPPVMLFFDCDGKTRTDLQLIGEVSANDVVKQVQKIGEITVCQFTKPLKHPSLSPRIPLVSGN